MPSGCFLMVSLCPSLFLATLPAWKWTPEQKKIGMPALERSGLHRQAACQLLAAFGLH